MLVLSRKVGERLHIGDDIVIVVSKTTAGRVTLGIEAPRDVRVLRGEICERDAKQDGGAKTMKPHIADVATADRNRPSVLNRNRIASFVHKAG